VAASKAARAKKVAQEKLKDISSVTITIQASEYNMQRLAAFLLFCEHLEPLFRSEDVRPLPWEDPNDPRFNQPPALELDVEALRRAIASKLLAFAERDGVASAKRLLQTYGGEGLAAIPPEQLPGLLDNLERLVG
jgi:hypothetical protein